VTAHELEDVLSRVRDHGGKLDTDTLEHMKSGVSVLETKLDEYYTESGSSATSEDAAVEAVDKASSGPATVLPSSPEESVASLDAQLRSDAVRAMLRESQQRGEELFRLRVMIETVPDLAYPRAFLVVNNLELGSAVIASYPALDQLGQTGGELTLIVTTSDDASSLARRVNVDEVSVVELSPLSYDQVAPSASSPSASEIQGRPQPEATSSMADELRLLAAVLHRAGSRLNGAPQLSDEKRTSARKLVTSVANYLSNRSPSTGKIQLLERIRSVRTEMERYASEKQKRLSVTVVGGALVWPGVADAVHDVVLHLIRNSIEHGLQYGPDRIQAGKRPTGRVSISIDRGRDSLITVTVKDDGRGIDLEEVRATVARTDPTASTMSLFELLATPGFTTRDEPSVGAGRGVGLDVVRHTVEKVLRGHVEMKSNPNEGVVTSISFSADVELLSVELVSQSRTLFAIPRAMIVREEILEPTRLKRDSFGTSFYESGGVQLPVIAPSGRAPRMDKLVSSSPSLICRGPDGLTVMTVENRLGTESVVWDEESKRVYSRKTGSDAQLVIPGVM
jgi:two-component system chemotaxis sensor kinase CheA